jgi:hypothetical protein
MRRFHHFLKHGRQAFRVIAVGVQQATATVAGGHEQATVRFAATNWRQAIVPMTRPYAGHAWRAPGDVVDTKSSRLLDSTGCRPAWATGSADELLEHRTVCRTE